MPAPSRLRPSISLLDLSAYFIIPAVGLPMLWGMFATDNPNRWFASALLAAFTVVLFLRERICSFAPHGRSLYVIVQICLIVALLWIPSNNLIAVILFFVLSAEVTMLFPERIAFAWIGVFTIITIAAYAILAGEDALIAAPIYIGGYLFFAVFAQQTARAEAARQKSDELLRELQVAHEQLQEYAAQAEELAVSQERNRLAREVHDTIGHRLTVSAVQLQAAERLIATNPTRATGIVATVREEVREALGELRRTVATLRAPLEADLSLGPALTRLAGTFEQATGIAVHLDVPGGLPSLPPNYRQAIYRSAQEGLTNIHKHAKARDAWLQIAQHNGSISLLVRDNGVGLPPQAADAPGFGLRGLRERASQLGGELRIDRPIDGGTQLLLTLPLDGPEQN